MKRPPDALATFVREDPLCRRLAALAAAHGRDMALVGGWVRDWLLGRDAPDWDLVVTGDPRPLVRALIEEEGRGTLVPLDESFGIFRTRLRSGLVLDFAQAAGPSLEADLARRDLTINALAVRLADGALLDPLDGRADLAAGVVRAPARANLADDPLRLVRVHRFAAALGFAVDAATQAWERELAPMLAGSAGERVLAELGKLLASGRAAERLAAMAAAGTLAPALGVAVEGAAARAAILEARMAASDPRLASWLAECVTGDRPRRALVVLAGVLEGLPPDAFALAAERLRWSKKEDALLRAWALDRPTPSALAEAAASPRAMHRLLKATGDAAPGVALFGGAPDLLAAYWHRVDHPLPRLVDGRALMAHLGLPPGPHLAGLLAAVEEAQALGEVTTPEEALACAARKGSEGV